jgi:hypothetical protein
MHKLIKYACEELEDLERKVDKGGKLSMQEIEYGDLLAHFKKNLMKCEEMEDGEIEYSGRGYSRRMSYADGGSYADGSYSERDYVRPDGSYARGRGAGAKRDSMGRYSREGGVDQQTKEELMKLIEKM